MRKTLSELTAVALASLLKLEKVTDANASITPDSMREDLASVEKLVKMRTAHPKTFGCLARSDSDVVVEDCDLVALPDASAQAQQDIAQLWPDVRAREVIKRVELIGRNAGGLKSLHLSLQMSQVT